jgi:hypothetical protein
MAQAKAAARSSSAPKTSAGSFNAATAAEHEAERLYKSGHTAEAAEKFYEASGLYRSAEIAAQGKAATAVAPTPTPPAPVVTPAIPEPPPAAPDRQPPLPPPVTAPAPPPVAAPPAIVPTPAPATPESAPAPHPTAEQAITELLARYQAALEARSLDALKRLWPSLGGQQQTAIQNEFQHASRIEVTLIQPQISIAGNTATVTFTRRYRLQTVDGQRLQTDTRTTMTLRQAGNLWVIDQIRFAQAQ